MLVDALTVRRAIEKEELYPCFQPLVEIRTGRLTGLEVLARWLHPEHGLILPDNFIAVAEAEGLIGELMQRMLNKALPALAALPEYLLVQVNVSPLQLQDPGLPEQVHRAAREFGFETDRLVIEITESALVNNLRAAQQIAGDLKALGCRLSLDDFGTGYSSLSHLQALPFDQLKVERSFVESITTRRESRKIVAAVVGLGHSLGLTTVAEGVQSAAQAEMLLRLGCDIGQGWFYGLPVEAHQLAALVAEAPKTLSPEPASAQSDWIVSSAEALPAQRLAQLQAIYNGAPVGLCFLDRNLRYISLNKRFADLIGAPISFLIGRRAKELTTEIYPNIEPYLLRVLQGEAISDVEGVLPSGTPGEPNRTLLLNYQPTVDEGGEVIGVSIAAVDITNRKIVENALHESEDHYRNMVELNPHIPWILDREGNVVDYSSRWEKLTGRTKAETLGWGWIQGLHPEDQQPTVELVQESMRTGKPINLDYRVKTAEGEWRWMCARGSPRYGPDGEILRWYGSLEDIDETKKMLKELQKNRGRRMAIFDAAPVCILVAEAPDGHLVMANAKARDFLPMLDLPGPAIADYKDWWIASELDGRELDTTEYPLALAVKTGQTTTQRELLIRPVGGREVRVIVSAAPIYGENAVVTGGVLVFQLAARVKREAQSQGARMQGAQVQGTG
jgi:PAS domain S-box-containing protein